MLSDYHFIFLLEKNFPSMVKGIDLSDLILKLLFFDIKTLIIGSLDAKTLSLWKTQINKIVIRQYLLKKFLNLSITLFK